MTPPRTAPRPAPGPAAGPLGAGPRGRLRAFRPGPWKTGLLRRAAGAACLGATAAAGLSGAGCTSVDYARLTGGDRIEALEQVPDLPRAAYAPPPEQTAEHDPRSTLGFAPQTIRDADAPADYWDLTLPEAIRYAIQNSDVARDLGAAVLRSPDAVQTRFDPALQYTDARFGPEAALAAFDAQFTTELLAANNDRIINNQFAGGGIQQFQQDLVVLRSELSKTTATGTRFALRGITEYDDNNAPANAFANIYDLSYEAEARQPLLRGSGVTFNRLAGPDAVPGFYNGVVIARVNNEITEAEFETGLRDFLSDVTNAYWELYFAYRNLEAKKQARDRALIVADTFRDRAAGDLEDAAEKELLAREQYYRFQGEVEEALAGRPIEFTFTGSGRGGGTFRGGGGVQTADRRLRLLMGVPVNEPRPVRPVLASEAVPADVRFDWSAVSARALDARPELRRQRLRVRRSEMELVAAKNFLSPRLDAVARYRLRGFGDDLLDPDGGPGDGEFTEGPAVLQPGSDAYDILSTGDFQEWEVGVEFSMPIGFRRAHAAVQNAELQTSRERALLREQERQVVYDLSNAVAEKDRAYQALQTAMNRYASAKQLLDELEVKFGVEKPRDIDADENAGDAEAAVAGTDGIGEVNLDRLLDAQRRVTDSELAVFRARAAFEVAVKNVFFETGELFQYHEVFLAGGGAGRLSPAPGGPGFAPPPAPMPADALPDDDATPAPAPLPADDAGDEDDAGADDDGTADEGRSGLDSAPAFDAAGPDADPAAADPEPSPADRGARPLEERPAEPLGAFDAPGFDAPGLPAPGRVSLDF